MPEPNEPDYRQSAVTGTKWRRSCHGEFDNAHGRIPWFCDPGATLALRNPETGALTGQTITPGELYAILWSLAMESAALADTQPAQESQ